MNYFIITKYLDSKTAIIMIIFAWVMAEAAGFNVDN